MSQSEWSYGFSYDGSTSTSGELVTVYLPNSGQVLWNYRNFMYVGGRTMREVATRNLRMDWNGAWLNYPLTRPDSTDANLTIHSQCSLDDASGVGEKTWKFNTSGQPWQIGTLTQFQQRNTPGGSQTQKQDDYTWVQEPTALNPYISAKLTTLDPGTSYQTQSQTTQMLDVYGNVTQSKIYDFGPTPMLARTYDNTYMPPYPAQPQSGYGPEYIRNRLWTSTVKAGASSTATPLVTNTYDQYSSAVCGSGSSNPIVDQSGIREHDGIYWTGFGNRGNVTTMVTPSGTKCLSYYLTGMASGAKDSFGHSTSVATTSDTNYVAPSSTMVNGDASTTTNNTFNYWFGLVTSVAPNNNAAATLSYDGFGRPATSQSPYGAQTSYVYGVRTQTATISKTTINGRFTRKTVDGLGRLARTESGDSGGVVQSVVDTIYASVGVTPSGQAWKVSMSYAPGATPIYTATIYDGLGRTVSVVLPSGAGTTSYVYQGNTTKVTDPAGNWKLFANDVFGNLAAVTEPDPAAPTTATFVTSYSYDAFGHLTQVSMPRNTGIGPVTQTRTFVYSTNNMLQSATNPENGTVTYTYNPDNSVATKTDAKSQVVKYTYDSFQRVLQIQRYPTGLSGGAEKCQEENYIYDSDPNLFSVNSLGRLVSIDWGCAGSGFYRTAYKYTPAGLIAAKRLVTFGLIWGQTFDILSLASQLAL